MALTDRQHKIYEELKTLLSLSSTATVEERRYLQQAKEAIGRGKNFKKSIHALNWNLKKIKAYKGALSPKVDALYEKTSSIYGNPVYDAKYVDWKDSSSDPRVFYGGSGRTSSWRRREELSEEKYQKTSKRWLWDGLSVSAVLTLILILLFSPVLEELKNILGDLIFFSLLAVVLLAIALWLLVSGRVDEG